LLSEAQTKNAIIDPPKLGNDCQPCALVPPTPAIHFCHTHFFKQFYKCQNFTILKVSKFYNSKSVKILQF
jgi:hypothetical protein